MSKAGHNKVSVVIPAYNSEKTIGQCMESIVRQRPLETIVVDDGSSDGTAETAKRYRVRLLRHKTNLGIAAARNTGVKAARGDIIVFVDSDCEAAPGLIKAMLSDYKSGVDGVGGRSVETGSSAADMWRRLTGGQGYGKNRKTGVPFLFGLCSSYRRVVLLEAGLFDTVFRTNGEDVDIGLRLNKMGKTLIYEPGAKVIHHRHDNFWSLARMIYRAYKFGYFAFLKNRGFRRSFEVFAAGAPLNFLKGISIIVAAKSGSKATHAALVVLALFAESLAFSKAVLMWARKKCLRKLSMFF